MTKWDDTWYMIHDTADGVGYIAVYPPANRVGHGFPETTLRYGAQEEMAGQTPEQLFREFYDDLNPHAGMSITSGADWETDPKHPHIRRLALTKTYK